MQLRQYLSTPKTQTSPMYGSSKIAARQMEAVYVLHSLAFFEDQTAQQFSIQTQPHRTSSISSNICIAIHHSRNTLKVGGANWAHDCQAQVTEKYRTGHEPSRILGVLRWKSTSPATCNEPARNASGNPGSDAICTREGTKSRKHSEKSQEESLYDYLRQNSISLLI